MEWDTITKLSVLWQKQWQTDNPNSEKCWQFPVSYIPSKRNVSHACLICPLTDSPLPTFQCSWKLQISLLCLRVSCVIQLWAMGTRTKGEWTPMLLQLFIQVPCGLSARGKKEAVLVMAGVQISGIPHRKLESGERVVKMVTEWVKKAIVFLPSSGNNPSCTDSTKWKGQGRFSWHHVLCLRPSSSLNTASNLGS